MPSTLHLTAFPQPWHYVTRGKMAWLKRSIWLYFKLQVVKLKQWKKLLNDWSVMLLKTAIPLNFTSQFGIYLRLLSLCNKWCTLFSQAAVLPVKSCAEAMTSQNLLSERTCWALKDKDEHSEATLIWKHVCMTFSQSLHNGSLALNIKEKLYGLNVNKGL